MCKNFVSILFLRFVSLHVTFFIKLFFRLTGTRFRPLSLELPKPLFPIGGFPVVYHHIEACKKVLPSYKLTSNIDHMISYDNLSIDHSISTITFIRLDLFALYNLFKFNIGRESEIEFV